MTKDAQTRKYMEILMQHTEHTEHGKCRLCILILNAVVVVGVKLRKSS